MFSAPFCCATYDGPMPGHSKQRYEPFSPNRFLRGHCREGSPLISACSTTDCSSAVPHQAGSTLMPNAGMLLSARYLEPRTNEFVITGSDREDVLLLDQRADGRGAGGRLALVARLLGELQLAAEDAAFLVDLVEVGLGPFEPVRVRHVERVVRRAGVSPDADLGLRDARTVTAPLRTRRGHPGEHHGEHGDGHDSEDPAHRLSPRSRRPTGGADSSAESTDAHVRNRAASRRAHSGSRDDLDVPRTLVSFHAHPDDEAIQTGGTIARASAEGHRVVLVFATRGEHGEVDDGFLGDGETLAERRVAETEAAASVLGVEPRRVPRVHGLRDGRDPRERRPDGSFWQADTEEAAGRLAAILREEDAEVLTVYDDHGGYDHPDHVQVHRVGDPRGRARGHAARLRGDDEPRRDQALHGRALPTTPESGAVARGGARRSRRAHDGDAGRGHHDERRRLRVRRHEAQGADRAPLAGRRGVVLPVDAARSTSGSCSARSGSSAAARPRARTRTGSSPRPERGQARRPRSRSQAGHGRAGCERMGPMPVVLLVFGLLVALLTLPGLIPVRSWAILFPAFFASFLGIGALGLVARARAGADRGARRARRAGLVGRLGRPRARRRRDGGVWPTRRCSPARPRSSSTVCSPSDVQTRARGAVAVRDRSCSPSRCATPDVERTKDLRYADGAGRRHLLDVYRARVPGTPPSPVIFQIHGGGWTIGTKDTQGRPLMNHFARAGLGVRRRQLPPEPARPRGPTTSSTARPRWPGSASTSTSTAATRTASSSPAARPAATSPR